jgi:hypothetical protein
MAQMVHKKGWPKWCIQKDGSNHRCAERNEKENRFPQGLNERPILGRTDVAGFTESKCQLAQEEDDEKEEEEEEKELPSHLTISNKCDGSHPQNVT